MKILNINNMKKLENIDLLGELIIFPKNEITYYQDHRFHVGIPDGIEFKVVKESTHDDYWLQADGYGNLDEPNLYGNGKICVKSKDILEILNSKS